MRCIVTIEPLEKGAFPLVPILPLVLMETLLITTNTNGIYLRVLDNPRLVHQPGLTVGWPRNPSVNRRGSIHIVQRKTPFRRPFPENLSPQNTDGEVARVDCEEDLFCNGWDAEED